MKANGFSLIELLVVTLIMSLLISFGFSTYTSSRVKTQTKFEQQYLLQIPSLIENYFSENLKYPDTLGDLLSQENGKFRTPKNYYFLNYSLSQNNSYEISATLNADIENSPMIECYQLIVKSSGELIALSSDNTDVSVKCWN